MIYKTRKMIDYGRIWNDLWRANGEPDYERDHPGIRDSRRWAELHDRIAKKNDRARAKALIGRLDVRKGDRVLNIGAGPGTHALLLSGMAREVIAIEHVQGMADTLDANIRAAGVTNVSCLRKKWEDVTAADIGRPCDLVLASLSSGIPDIRAALEKMDRLCARRVCIAWPAGMTAMEKHCIEVWPVLHGEEYRPGPKADVLFNVLYQMGICPDVEVFREECEDEFTSVAEATEYYRPLCRVCSQEQEMSLLRYLGRNLDRSSGILSMRGVSPMALLSWDVMINRVWR